MYHGKRVRVRKFRKIPVLLASLVVLLCATAATTLAYLATQTEGITNTFIPAEVRNEISEDLDDNTKKDVTVKNTGNVDAYIRAQIIVTWVDEKRNPYGGAVPALGTDYTITWPESSDWTKGSDGFYYYKQPVAPDDSTTNLFDELKVVENLEGYRLSVEILSQSIQAEPEEAVENAWGMSVKDGKLEVKQ